LARILISVNP